MIIDQTTGLIYWTDPHGGLYGGLYTATNSLEAVPAGLATEPTALMRRIYNLINRTGKTVDLYDRSALTTHNDLKVTPPEMYKDVYLTGDLIKYGDVKIALSPVTLTFIPDLSDIVTIDSVKWMVVSTENIWMSDNLILYELHLRKHGNTQLVPSSLWSKIDQKLVPAAYRIIQAKGIDATFHAAQDYTRKVVTQPEFDSRLIDGDTIEMGDIRVHLAGYNLPFTPKAGMMATYDDKKWLIAGEFPIYSGEQVCIFELLLRR